MDSLGVLNGSQLFSLSKEELMDVCFQEGPKVYSFVTVQKSLANSSWDVSIFGFNFENFRQTRKALCYDVDSYLALILEFCRWCWTPLIWTWTHAQWPYRNHHHCKRLYLTCSNCNRCSYLRLVETTSMHINWETFILLSHVEIRSFHPFAAQTNCLFFYPNTERQLFPYLS